MKTIYETFLENNRTAGWDAYWWYIGIAAIAVTMGVIWLRSIIRRDQRDRTRK